MLDRAAKQTVGCCVERLAPWSSDRGAMEACCHRLTLFRDLELGSRADDDEVTVFSSTGRPLRRIRRDTQPDRTDERAWQSYVETLIENRPAGDRALTRRRFHGAGHPDTHPAYARLVVDTRGHLWVAGFRRDPRSSRTWSIFDPEGVWLGDLEMPGGLHVLEIGDDYVLGRFTGELGQESVRLYALER